MSRFAETAQPNEEQARYWRSTPGQKWVELQDVLDTTFGLVNDVLLARAAPAAGERALDVGCGTGAVTLDLAARLGPEGRAVAIDISPLLLARAVERTPASLAARITFVEADAQTHAFTPAGFDLLISRFGVMFFADPVAAFRNLRKALRPGGRLHVAAWAPIEVNPWFQIPRDAAIARLGRPAPTSPTAPGPFAFSDSAHVLEILREAGFRHAAAEVVEVDLAPPGDVEAVTALMTSIGPAVRIIAELDGGPDDVAAIGEAIADRLGPYRTAEGVRVPAAIILFAATAP